jgi:hypothetical protein
MRIHKRRYLNALKKAAKINRYLKKGYHVFYGGDRIDKGFVLEDNQQIVLKLSDNISVLFYENSPDWDHGYWTSIKKYNEAFSEDFQVYKPSARIEL